MFGTLTDYDYVVTSHDLDMDVGEDDLVVFEGNPHVIRRISRSLNVLSMAVRRVNISE